MTLVGATLTLLGVFANIENQRIVNSKNRAKKLAASRAFLPSVLSSISEVCKFGVRVSEEFADYQARLGADFERQSIHNLTLSNETITVLKDIIELTDSEDVTGRIAGLVREHQIFLARWKDEFSPIAPIMIAGREDVRKRTVQWAYLLAITSSIFEYARGESDDVTTQVGEAEIRSSLRIAGPVALDADEFADEIGLYARSFKRRF